MDHVDIAHRRVYAGTSGPSAPVIYLIDSPEHPFDATTLQQERTATIVTVPVTDWNAALTPWQASGIYRGEPNFGGQGQRTLSELVGTLIPAVEADEGLSPTGRAICGYSLGGLFALYALTHCEAFVACACLSGSVWYEGWVEHLGELPLDLAGHFAYLSIGTKERKAARPILKTVQDRMEQCVGILQQAGCQVEYRTSPGNHMQHVSARLAAGLSALDAFLAARAQGYGR